MGHGVYTTKKNMSNGIYFKMILDISDKLKTDRELNKINKEQYDRLWNIVNSFWVELVTIDRENGIEVDE